MSTLGQLLKNPSLPAKLLVKEPYVHPAVIQIGLAQFYALPKKVDILYDGVVRGKFWLPLFPSDTLVQLGIVVVDHIIHIAGETWQHHFQLCYHD